MSIQQLTLWFIATMVLIFVGQPLAAATSAGTQSSAQQHSLLRPGLPVVPPTVALAAFETPLHLAGQAALPTSAPLATLPAQAPAKQAHPQLTEAAAPHKPLVASPLASKKKFSLRDWRDFVLTPSFFISAFSILSLIVIFTYMAVQSGTPIFTALLTVGLYVLVPLLVISLIAFGIRFLISKASGR
jgi:hypothetical protein